VDVAEVVEVLVCLGWSGAIGNSATQYGKGYRDIMGA